MTVLLKIIGAAVLVAALVKVIVLGLLTYTPDWVLGSDMCQPGRYIIQVHGTMSTGAFDPQSALVRDLDPRQPDATVFASGKNEELRGLFKASADCVITFSYDDVYLTRDGTSTPGVYAWNKITSPWDRLPDELATNLQHLMDAQQYRQATFDIVAYSAGGIVPTYWAARASTTDAQRARVHSIVVVDGVVSGARVDAFDFACAVRSLRSWRVPMLGRLPCQFRFDGEYTGAVRTSDWWTKIRFATVRADGDLIVWYDVAGLPGKAIDPELHAQGCAWWEQPLYGVIQCVLRTHGSVLHLEDARKTTDEMIGP